MRSFLLVAVDRVPTASAIPDIPLIERKPQFLRRPFASTYHVAHCNGFRDLPLHAQVHGQKFPAIAAGFLRSIADVAMQGERIDIVVALLQDLTLPFQVGGHERATRSTSNELKRGIDIVHLPSRILSF